MVCSNPPPPFFESGPVPAPLSTTMSHTVFHYLSAPPTITAHEEVVPLSNQSNPSMQGPRTPTPEQPSEICFTDKLSRHNSITSFHQSVSPSSQTSREDSPTSSDSDLTSISTGDEMEKSIPKPPREAGRPKSGGYNLKCAIHLNEFNNIKVGHHVYMTINVNYSSSRNLCLSQLRSLVILTQGAIMLHKEQMQLNLYTTMYVSSTHPSTLFIHCRQNLNFWCSGNTLAVGRSMTCWRLISRTFWANGRRDSQRNYWRRGWLWRIKEIRTKGDPFGNLPWTCIN